jgi:hypothetical protein
MRLKDVIVPKIKSTSIPANSHSEKVFKCVNRQSNKENKAKEIAHTEIEACLTNKKAIAASITSVSNRLSTIFSHLL